ncbi:RDD family protein [Paraglaciecola aquimarina]|uniref:RDD family protein n=1 Tax=Paraglaciecola algarum TaxID=3050085 RepID=A0ABS9D4P9_9ALTE|nr:RDD family protein [Paraglaciecola sp. G1-23]MCF2947003.1 RDD family protein [Paraglaciecola sp. G1-23]
MENTPLNTEQDASIEAASSVNKMSAARKETRQIVTPYAFHVSSDLFGTPLASPLKRAFALSIDVCLLWLLTQASGFFLAGVAAATFFRAGNRLKQKKRFNGVRICLRFLTAILLFVFVMGILDAVDFGPQHNEPSKKSFGAAEGIATIGLTGKYIFQLNNTEQRIADELCLNQDDCWQQLSEELTSELVDSEIETQKALEILEIVADMQSELVPTLKQNNLKKHLLDLYEFKSSKDDNTFIEPEVKVFSPLASEDNQKSNVVSLVDWIKVTLDDLGLGFGWAAFYFSVFTAWWRGQTPGKKVVGIKVLKLDNSELTLWESFGRYGGYGAGLATGLMGFLQIFWDPNRQAIQDKISETLVIDIRKDKQEFSLNEQ